MKKLAIILVSVVTGFTGVVPAQAFPTVSAVSRAQTSDVVNAQYINRGGGLEYGDRRYWRNRDRHWRGDRRHWRSDRRYWRDDRRWRRHRDRSNFGAALGGFAAGAIIGGALAQPRYAPAPRYSGGGSAHVNWCYSRYRSYRPYDNTFQPYNGPRRQCYSPYR
ncbi:BA14K family protein [Rhizobium sp. LC145]|uniref:BA14K family protein n=1 Tax=Rhizobium sp. LC145 TaxID=1120688 RepID=UPI00062A04FD|nr:BA14K family protein [Rhizobium sp. LC145]KKX34316.1 hypothetical protein YH62_03975 [Rhizobium sp. LC145]TKT65553.1 BA14K family protein [Rhizobiaceae bacterium LC148]